MPTDSVTGTYIERYGDGFLLESDDGREYFFEIAPDTLEDRTTARADTASPPVPHASVMDYRDIVFVLEQLDASEERQRMHVHYVTVGEGEGRRIAVWLSIARDRVPGG